MENRKLNLKLFFVIGAAALLIIAAVVLVILYKKPLGASLATPAGIQAAGTASETAASPATAAAADVTAPTAVTSKPAEVCGETAVWNILVVGSDAADMFYPQGSDLTRVMRVDFPNRRVAIYAFSRDLWVQVSDLAFTDPDIAATMLGMVFYEARLRSAHTDPQEAMLDGVNATAHMLTSNFNLTSDHYLAIDLDRLPAMIDTIGGLPINIPEGFTDPHTELEFEAGQQTLDGYQASIYARSYLGSDLSRIQRNNLVIEALRQKLLDPAVWLKIPELYLQFRDAVLTDFSPEQVTHLTCLLQEVAPEAIIQDGVPEEWTSEGPEGSLLWNRTNVLNRLRELEMIP
jgi:LCP family protein required for cell wall assembly